MIASRSIRSSLLLASALLHACLTAPEPAHDAAVGCERFAGAEGYILCEATPDSCEFFTTIEGTCQIICAMFSAECVASYDSGGSNRCFRESPDEGCEVAHGSQICTCTGG